MSDDAPNEAADSAEETQHEITDTAQQVAHDFYDATEHFHLLSLVGDARSLPDSARSESRVHAHSLPRISAVARRHRG
jgi:hypothetical protein